MPAWNPHNMVMTITIDGSQGEGGGQVLRTALTLSAMTGQALQLINIRAGRERPGLAAQHLTAVEAMAQISGAEVEGGRKGSTSLFFRPGPTQQGFYRFDIGTAGATSLVLQTVILPLTRVEDSAMASTVAVTGGTHVPWSPPYHYLQLNWVPALDQMGLDVRLVLKRAGFYPPGGGRVQAAVRPGAGIRPLHWPERGRLLGVRGVSGIAGLPDHISERQRRQALRRLRSFKPVEIEIQRLEARSAGTFLLLQAEFEHGRACFSALGKKGLPAEEVANLAVDELSAFLETGAAVDRYLADQLLLPLAFAGGPSLFTTERVTSHLLTNAAVIEAFGVARIQISGELGDPGRIQVQPAGGTGG